MKANAIDRHIVWRIS